MADVEGKIIVHQGVDANYLQNILTKDITVLEALFDLVDNSIDAARETLFKAEYEKDSYGLPASYSGFWIGLRTSATYIAIKDNCGGIDEEELRDRVFVTGSISNHKYGIGRFGIGLKRALFRLGSVYALSTDTGDFAAKLGFGREDLGQLTDNPMTAIRGTPKGAARSAILISKLPEGVAHEVGAESFNDSLMIELERRYGRFIAKGLVISVNGRRLGPFGPAIRKRGPSPRRVDFDDKLDGVSIFLESGMHELYRASTEKGYDKQTNDGLTDQYGWYFVCNDRIIRIATHESNLGWSAHWHQEYYGFVGWVHFVAADVDDLPWDTKKTAIDHYSPAFRQIANRLQEMADAYKAETRAYRKEAGKSGSGATGSGTTGSGKAGSKKGAKAEKSSSGTKAKSNEAWPHLLPEMTVLIGNRKVEALVAEATELPLTECYAGSMLLRAIMEQSLLAHLRGNGGYVEIQAAWEAERVANGKAPTLDQVRNHKPSFEEMLKWFDQNTTYFPAEKLRECKNARGKFAKHLGELNGVMHENDLTNSSKLKTVRDDSYPLLEFLIGTKPTK